MHKLLTHVWSRCSEASLKDVMSARVTLSRLEDNCTHKNIKKTLGVT